MRFLKLSLIVFSVFSTGAVASYATGLWGLLSAGYPRAVWPALGGFDTVQGSHGDTAQAPVLKPLNRTARDLFDSAQSRALLVNEGGRTVLETYADGLGPGTRLNSFSLVKSLVGALVLKAVAEGRIKSLDDPLGAYLPAFGPASLDHVPLRDLLDMRSGLAFEADSSDKIEQISSVNPFGNLARLHGEGIEAVASRLSVKPDRAGRFSYQNVNTALLGHLLSDIYGEHLSSLLSRKIWQPSGAADAFWLRHRETAAVTAYCCLYATARDWARVGRFLMKNGTTEAPFLPDPLWGAFFGNSLTETDVAQGAYRLHLRHDRLDREGEALQGRFAYMMGQGGQIVYMMPEKDLVAVRFGERHALLHSTLYAAWNSLHTP